MSDLAAGGAVRFAGGSTEAIPKQRALAPIADFNANSSDQSNDGTGDLQGFTVSGGRVFVSTTAPSVLVFDANGAFLQEIGRAGDGPGEYRTPTTLAALSESRLAVLDDGPGRDIQVFRQSGEFLASWENPAHRFGAGHLYVVDTDRVFIAEPVRDAGVPSESLELIPVGPDAGDARIRLPSFDVQIPKLTVQVNSRQSVTMAVPHAGAYEWAIASDGALFAAWTTQNAFEIHDPAGVVTMVISAFDPAEIPAAQADWLRADIERRIRRVRPSWSWPSIAAIPDHKPYMKSFAVSADGLHVWVFRETESRAAPHCGDMPAPGRPRCWSHRYIADVFDRVGNFVERVDLPAGFLTYPIPYIEGNEVFAAMQDTEGDKILTRFGIE